MQNHEMSPGTFVWFTAAAVATWIACGLWPVAKMVDGSLAGWPAVLYAGGFTLYGAALLVMLMLLRHRPHTPLSMLLALAILQTAMAVMTSVDTNIHLHDFFTGIGLLIIVAGELPYLLPSSGVWLWIVAQTAVLMWALGGVTPNGGIEKLTFTIATIGFQGFAGASSMLARREGQARTHLARANAELLATRDLLAESSRTAERLRISRDLHDTLGHHLTALSLQLDVASRTSEGAVAERIQQAHAIVRLLLADVRDVVNTLRERSKLNLAEAIRALALQPVSAHIHLALPDAVVVDDTARAEAILRAVQEVLTNTARHAGARNLWIRFEPAPDGVMFHSRDDGRGTSEMIFGNGLQGMRERFEAYGGRLDVTSGPGAGFEVRAFMPLPAAA
jgi:signal transduction histidine kinase